MNKKEKTRQVLELLRHILDLHERFYNYAKSPNTSGGGQSCYNKLKENYRLLPEVVKKKLTSYPCVDIENFPAVVRKLIDPESKEQLKRAIASYEKRLQELSKTE